jgi:hypothetical protein
MLHITSYHYYPLVDIHSYQGYFDMLCHCHLNMCYIIRLHVNVLILFKRLLTRRFAMKGFILNFIYLSMKSG